VTYTAQWRINQYTATFNANGGTGGKAVTQNYGTVLTAPMVMRTGYTFTGWSPSVPSTMPAGNTTYTAQWRIDPKIPELGIDGDYFSAFKVMVDITWRLNAETEYDVVRLIQGLNLPDNYVGCQIRGGDKIIETELLSPDLYIKLLDKITFLKNIFVLTDDFQIFKRLQIKSPENNWYTLCEDGEGGYVNKAFSRQIGNVKRLQMIRFIASMQILMQSSVFVGSITTAPSLFLLKLFYPNHCPIDCSTEAFEQIVSLRMDERCRMAQIYLSGQS
jgi:hypothetical protein